MTLTGGENQQVIIATDNVHDLFNVSRLLRKLKNADRNKLMFLAIGKSEMTFHSLISKNRTSARAPAKQKKGTNSEASPNPEFALLADCSRYTISCGDLHSPEFLINKRLYRVWHGCQLINVKGFAWIGGIRDILGNPTECRVIVGSA
jgi:hypothetical protein